MAKSQRLPSPKQIQTYLAAEFNRPSGWKNPFHVGPFIGDCLKDYHREHSHRRYAAAYIVTETINQFLSVTGLHENMPLTSLTKERCKFFKVSLLNHTAPLSVGRGRGRRPGPVTINRKLSALHHFIKWCVNNEHMETDVMQGLALPARLVSSSRTRKEAFSDEELSTILKALASYREHADVLRREWFWIVLLLLHSGCRAMEVVQLLRADVRQIDGIWCLDLVGEGEGRQLKNRESVRKVPIHSNMVAAGFLDWHRQQQGLRLFPTAFPFGATKTSQLFSVLLKRTGIKRPTVSLHSLRHTLTQKLARAKTFPPLQNRLLGHAIGTSVEERTYMGSMEYSVKELSEALEKIQMPCL
jgi:integrase